MSYQEFRGLENDRRKGKAKTGYVFVCGDGDDDDTQKQVMMTQEKLVCDKNTEKQTYI